MADPDYITKVRELLKEGKAQEADDLLSEVQRTRGDAALLAAGKPAEPPPPRDPDVIVHDFMVAVADKFGNLQVLEDLAAEFQHVFQLHKAR